MTCRGVFFDLYGTLLVYGDMTAAWADWLTALHDKLAPLGLGIDRAGMAERCRGLFSLPEPPDQGDGLTVYERRLRALCGELGLDVPRAALSDAADDSARAWQRYVPADTDAQPVLRALGVGRKLALVSNYDHPRVARQYLAESDLMPLLDCIVISGEVGVKKPDPAIIRLALAATGLDAGDVVFVGDAPEDVAAARAAGCQPVRIRRQAADPFAEASDFDADRSAAAASWADGVTTVRSLADLIPLVEGSA